MADGSRIFDARETRDPTALTAVYRAHARYVWRVLRHCGVPEPDLDDAVQETFLVVFRRLPEFQACASLRTWIYAVTVRVASTRRRSQRREAARRDQAGHRMHGAGAADPEAALSKAEAADLVDRLLDGLDAPQRTVFVLAELEGVKVPEISRILGINPRTVHSRLRLARARFGSALERLQAHEANNRRVARLRPRPLLTQAANDRPSAARRKAAMAALAMRIEQGATPTLAGWEGLALGGGAGTYWLPVAVIGGLGAVAMAVVVGTGSPPPGSRSSADASEHQPSKRRVATRASPTNEPIVRAGSMIDVPLVPNARPGTAGSSGGDPLGQSGTTLEPTDDPIVRVESTIEPVDDDSVRPPTAIRSPDHARVRADVAATASTLAAETRLLEQARTALRRGDLEAVWVALDLHAAEFSDGLLSDEARSTRLRALCAGGRLDEATALAERLAPGQPGSRWHDVVTAACR